MILAVAERKNLYLFDIGIVVAFLTTFYMFRLILVVFFGKPRSKAAAEVHAKRSQIIAYPYAVLGSGRSLPGFLASRNFWARSFSWKTRPRFFSRLSLLCNHQLRRFWEPQYFRGAVAAWSLYRDAATDPLPAILPGLTKLLRNKFYFDEMYAWLIAATQDALAGIADWFDRWIIAGMICAAPTERPNSSAGGCA